MAEVNFSPLRKRDLSWDMRRASANWRGLTRRTLRNARLIWWELRLKERASSARVSGASGSAARVDSIFSQTLRTRADVPASGAAISGRQRRQARKPARSASAELSKKRTCWGLGRREGQEGRQ